MLIRYQAEDKPLTINPTATRGVSGLLQADRSALIPEGNERMARRKPRLAPESCDGGESDGGFDGDAQRPILPLPVLKTKSNAANG
jgi:lysine 2,3-aminomutase